MPFHLEDVIILSHAPKLNIEALAEGIFVKVRRTEGGLSQITATVTVIHWFDGLDLLAP